MRCLVLPLAWLILAGVVHAQDRWQLTETDFRSRVVELHGIADDHVAVRDGRVPIDRVLRLRRESAESRPSGPLVLHLHSAARLPGTPVKIEGESLRWRSTVLGEVVVPLKQARGILLLNAPDDALPSEAAEDELRLQNGDVVRGIVNSLSQAEIVVRTADGRDVTAPVASLQQLLFASVGSATPSRQRAFAVATLDGSRFTCESLRTEGGQLRVKAFGSDLVLPLAQVIQVEQLNGAVTWLSSLTPDLAEHTPYFGVEMPPRMDRGVTGAPIRVGGRGYDRGIGVHSRTVLKFPLDGTHKAFRTAFAIDGDLPLACVDVRILADGKELYSRKSVRAGEAMTAVSVPLDGARQLTLEVDFGENFDVQDRFVWIEPALLK